MPFSCIHNLLTFSTNSPTLKIGKTRLQHLLKLFSKRIQTLMNKKITKKHRAENIKMIMAVFQITKHLHSPTNADQLTQWSTKHY